MKRSLKKMIVVFLSVVCGVSLATTIVMVFRYQGYRRIEIMKAHKEVIDKTEQAAKEIDDVLREVMFSAESIASDLTTGKLPRDKTMLSRLKTTIEQNDNYYGGTITFRPGMYEQDRNLFSAYYVKEGGKVLFKQLDLIYDYTEPKPENEWYTRAMNEGSIWTEPYFCEAGVTFMTTYSAVFYAITDTEKRLGVVTIDISMDQIREIVRSIDLGVSGFGSLVTLNGTYLYHPDTKLINKNIREVAEKKKDEDRLIISRQIQEFKESDTLDLNPRYREHKSITTGLQSLLVYQAIPSSQWIIINTFDYDDIFLDRYDDLRQMLITITVLSVVFSLSSVLLVFTIFCPNSWALWGASLTTSILLLAGIAYTWHLALTYSTNIKKGEAVITNKQKLIATQQSLVATEKTSSSPNPYFLPTGILVETIRFVSMTDVVLSGYVWQKYPRGDIEHLEGRVIIADAEEFEIDDKPSAYEVNDAIVKKWHFKATVRQYLNFSKYPLNQETLRFHLLVTGLNHNVVLVPDLDAYKVLIPRAQPGLKEGLRLLGWQLLRTYFSLTSGTGNTNMGVKRSVTEKDLPVLTYHISIRRNFLDSFISNLIPLIVVAILLFLILVISTENDDLITLLGVDAGKTLSFCAALFFVVVFAQIDIRKKIAANEIFYLEYFYFVMYSAILWVAVNAISFAKLTRFSFLQYRDNLIAKLLFLPFLLVISFLITCSSFYY